MQAETKSYFYSLNGNVVETTEQELIEAIRLSPQSEHMIYNNTTQSWNNWKTYPNIYQLVNNKASNNQ